MGVHSLCTSFASFLSHPHLGNRSGQREKRLLLQQFLIHGGDVGLDMELIGFSLSALRLAQAEVVVRRPIVGDAGKRKVNMSRTCVLFGILLCEVQFKFGEAQIKRMQGKQRLSEPPRNDQMNDCHYETPVNETT